MRRRAFIRYVILVCCVLAIGAPASYRAVAYPAQPGNVLINGDFEIEDPSTGGFIWYYPNHYVAPHWYRWWINNWPSGPLMPEYDDMRPGYRWPPLSGRHAQVYFRWGFTYEAGIYQVVQNLTPCVPYEFRMYVHSSGNQGTQPRARIGLDPQGTQITQGHDANDLLGWPPYMQWSAEQTALYTWQELAVTAEPLGTRLTAMTYANPTYDGPRTPWYDTWWDAGSMLQQGFPDGKLPEPASWDSTLITNVQSTVQGDQLIVTWDSTVPASTQVWYTIHRYAAPITPTVTLSVTTYLPFVAKSLQRQSTALDPQPVTAHSASIPLTGLQPLDRVEFWVLSRRPGVDACITEGRGPFEVSAP